MQSGSGSAFDDDLCPSCQTKTLCRPKQCTGHHNPEHTGDWYQQCPDNTHRPDSVCNGFRWRPDLKSDAEALKIIPCTGSNCAARPKPFKANKMCIRTMCRDCCQQSDDAGLLRCKAPRHAHQATRSEPAAPSTSAPQFVPQQHYGRMLTDTYAEKIRRGNFELGMTGGNYLRNNAYARDEETHVRVLWWMEDNSEPVNFSVPATEYPFFHPDHCETIKAVLGPISCRSYGVFDVISHTWSITPSAQRVKPGDTLRLRSIHVKTCNGVEDGLPPTKKRSFDGVTDQGRARVKVRHIIDLSNEPVDELTPPKLRSLSPAAAPPSSPTPSTPAGSICDPESPEKQSSSLDANVPSGTRSKWPYRYFIDMAKGFQAMEGHKARGVSKTAEQFVLSFGGHFSRSTFSDNHKVWVQIPEVEKDVMLAAGRTPKGEWVPVAEAKTMLRAILGVPKLRNPPFDAGSVAAQGLQHGLSADWNIIAEAVRFRVKIRKTTGQDIVNDIIQNSHFNDKKKEPVKGPTLAANAGAEAAADGTQASQVDNESVKSTSSSALSELDDEMSEVAPPATETSTDVGETDDRRSEMDIIIEPENISSAAADGADVLSVDASQPVEILPLVNDIGATNGLEPNDGANVLENGALQAVEISPPNNIGIANGLGAANGASVLLVGALQATDLEGLTIPNDTSTANGLEPGRVKTMNEQPVSAEKSDTQMIEIGDKNENPSDDEAVFISFQDMRNGSSGVQQQFRSDVVTHLQMVDDNKTLEVTASIRVLEFLRRIGNLVIEKIRDTTGSGRYEQALFVMPAKDTALDLKHVSLELVTVQDDVFGFKKNVKIILRDYTEPASAPAKLKNEAAANYIIRKEGHRPIIAAIRHVAQKKQPQPIHILKDWISAVNNLVTKYNDQRTDNEHVDANMKYLRITKAQIALALKREPDYLRLCGDCGDMLVRYLTGPEAKLDVMRFNEENKSRKFGVSSLKTFLSNLK
ncbi:hypothetical protein BD410DRAFT_810301 [Rickenella mellea]|uniref:Uncharacterized protein n=1 Tax=Rickenella mellea TaxID=50990 RepID=A0A4Y7PH63_9AGAM|nr:hypothetical protein BD410DRAFT_810301 [Rickenella mellea]